MLLIISFFSYQPEPGVHVHGDQPGLDLLGEVDDVDHLLYRGVADLFVRVADVPAPGRVAGVEDAQLFPQPVQLPRPWRELLQRRLRAFEAQLHEVEAFFPGIEQLLLDRSPRVRERSEVHKRWFHAIDDKSNTGGS